MKRVILIFCVLMSAASMRSEDTIVAAVDSAAVDSVTVAVEQVAEVRPNLLEEMKGVEVVQDSAVGVLLDLAINGKRELVEIDGFRVQVYSSNQQQTAKMEALELEAKLKEKVTHTIYVQYLPPFWKVRLGDFRTYEEARDYKKLFVQLFPQMMGDTYIVRDKIQVIQ